MVHKKHRGHKTHKKHIEHTGQKGALLMQINGLSEAAKKARREYQKKYRANNKERIQEIGRRYWEKKARGTGSGENQQNSANN